MNLYFSKTNGSDRMDIISEILETDRLADEKIIKAHETQAQLEQQTQAQTERYKQQAQEKVEAYRQKTDARTKSEIDGQIAHAQRVEELPHGGDKRREIVGLLRKLGIGGVG